MLIPNKPIDCCDSAKGKCISLTDCLAYRSALNNRLVIVEGKVTTLEEDVDDLDGRMDTAESTLINHGNRLTTIEGKYVTIDTAQTISGTKTYTNIITISRGSEVKLYIKDTRMDTSSTTSASYWNPIIFTDANNKKLAQVSAYQNGAIRGLRNYTFKADGITNWDFGFYGDISSDTAYMFSVTPTTGAPTNAVPTIAWVSNTGGSLNNLVHTNGDETVNGYKKFSLPIRRSSTYDLKATPSDTTYVDLIQLRDGNDIFCFSLYLTYKTDGTATLNSASLKSDGTWDRKTIVTIRSSN